MYFRFKHRNWPNIIKEHKRQKETAIWLTAERALEIWNILKKTRNKMYSEKTVLKLLLYIVHYYNCLEKLVGYSKDIFAFLHIFYIIRGSFQ